VSRFGTILVPTDFSGHARTALDLAIALAKDWGARIHLVHAYELPAGPAAPYGLAIPEAVMLELRDAAARHLEKSAQLVSQAGLACQTHLEQGAPAPAILAVARSTGAELIVMGTRGLTGWRHALLGSVAEHTIRKAPCPVITIKGPPEPAG
jgi:nucleotide-binding universal stress UspA family protein